MQRSHILSTGSFLPEKIISNEDLTQFSPEARKLIAEKTGVQTRRHASEAECTSDLAIAAARKCLQKVDFPPGKCARHCPFHLLAGSDAAGYGNACTARAGGQKRVCFRHQFRLLRQFLRHHRRRLPDPIGKVQQHPARRFRDVLQDPQQQGFLDVPLLRGRRGRGALSSRHRLLRGGPALLPRHRRQQERHHLRPRGRNDAPL